MVIMILLFSCEVMSDSFVTPWVIFPKAPLSRDFPARIQKWVAFPSPGYLPDTGMEPVSPTLSLLCGPTLNYMATGKIIALTIRTFVGKVMSLRLTSLSRSKCLF